MRIARRFRGESTPGLTTSGLAAYWRATLSNGPPRISWQLERIERAQCGPADHQHPASGGGRDRRLKKEGQDVDALGAAAIRGPSRAASALSRHYERRSNSTPRTSCSGIANGPDNPVRLIKQLESTAVGCDWLLARWAELQARLEPGQSWQSPDKLKAIRLLGKQPLDAADDADVASIFIACHVIDPQYPSAFYEIRSDADRLGMEKIRETVG